MSKVQSFRNLSGYFQLKEGCFSTLHPVSGTAGAGLVALIGICALLTAIVAAFAASILTGIYGLYHALLRCHSFFLSLKQTCLSQPFFWLLVCPVLGFIPFTSDTI